MPASDHRRRDELDGHSRRSTPARSSPPTPSQAQGRGGAEGGGRQDRAAVALVQVGPHAGHVADVVADVVGDDGRVARVVLGDARLDLADEVGADVGGLGEDAAADAGEQRLRAGAHAEGQHHHRDLIQRHAGSRRPSSASSQARTQNQSADVQQAQADDHQAHHRAGAEGDLQASVERLLGPLRRAVRGQGRGVHADEPAQAAEEAAGQEREGNQRVLLLQHERLHRQQHRPGPRTPRPPARSAASGRRTHRPGRTRRSPASARRRERRRASAGRRRTRRPGRPRSRSAPATTRGGFRSSLSALRDRPVTPARGWRPATVAPPPETGSNRDPDPGSRGGRGRAARADPRSASVRAVGSAGRSPRPREGKGSTLTPRARRCQLPVAEIRRHRSTPGPDRPYRGPSIVRPPGADPRARRSPRPRRSPGTEAADCYAERDGPEAPGLDEPGPMPRTSRPWPRPAAGPARRGDRRGRRAARADFDADRPRPARPRARGRRRPRPPRCSPTRPGPPAPDATRSAGQGGDVGPDLSDVGAKLDRPYLIESVLEPSRQIVEGYRATVVATGDGRVLTGLVRGERDGTLVLVDAEAREILLPARPGRASALGSTPRSMPEGLAARLSPERVRRPDRLPRLAAIRRAADPRQRRQGARPRCRRASSARRSPTG